MTRENTGPDIYQLVTDRIIQAIEAGTPPWQKPWTGGAGFAGFPRRSNGEFYKGINVVILLCIAAENGYRSSYWLTYKQAKVMDAQVRRGEKSAPVVKYGTFEVDDPDRGETVVRPYARGYRVFNADQIDGLPNYFYGADPDEPRDLGTEPNVELDRFFAATGIEIRTTDEPQAFYHLLDDYVHMPPIATFHSASGYYASLAHEMIHATSHKRRLDRDQRFTRKSELAFEELCAEIGSAMLCVSLGLVPDFEQSAAYVESWLRSLKDDKKFIFRAASEAQKAVDWMHAQRAQNEDEGETSIGSIAA